MEQKYGIGHMFQIIKDRRTQHLVKVVHWKNVKIGNNCKIQNNVSIFDGVTIEDEFFGPSTTFTNIKIRDLI